MRSVLEIADSAVIAAAPLRNDADIIKKKVGFAVSDMSATVDITSPWSVYPRQSC